MLGFCHPLVAFDDVNPLNHPVASEHLVNRPDVICGLLARGCDVFCHDHDNGHGHGHGLLPVGVNEIDRVSGLGDLCSETLHLDGHLFDRAIYGRVGDGHDLHHDLGIAAASTDR